MIKVKICGLTNLEDAQVVVEAGADLLGFIFYEPSPRYVRPDTVREIVTALRSEDKGHSPLFVGVFVDVPPERVSQILDFCHLDAAQLHGAEPPEVVAYFQGRAFKVLRPPSLAEAEALVQKYQPPEAPVPAALPTFMVDAYHPQLYGGTGHVTDWSMAASLARHYPLMLAGSLTSANVAEAIQAVQPWGVDASSGVEARKGKKDAEKVREFVERAKEGRSRSS